MFTQYSPFLHVKNMSKNWPSSKNPPFLDPGPSRATLEDAVEKTVRSVKKGRHHFGAGKCHFNGIRSIFELERVIFHGARTVGTWELASLQGSCGVGLGLV